MKNEEDSFKTAVCPKYEDLLKECQAALEIWEGRRDEICPSRASGKKVRTCSACRPILPGSTQFCASTSKNANCASLSQRLAAAITWVLWSLIRTPECSCEWRTLGPIAVPGKAPNLPTRFSLSLKFAGVPV